MMKSKGITDERHYVVDNKGNKLGIGKESIESIREKIMKVCRAYDEFAVHFKKNGLSLVSGTYESCPIQGENIELVHDWLQRNGYVSEDGVNWVKRKGYAIPDLDNLVFDYQGHLNDEYGFPDESFTQDSDEDIVYLKGVVFARDGGIDLNFYGAFAGIEVYRTSPFSRVSISIDPVILYPVLVKSGLYRMTEEVDLDGNSYLDIEREIVSVNYNRASPCYINAVKYSKKKLPDSTSNLADSLIVQVNRSLGVCDGVVVHFFMDNYNLIMKVHYSRNVKKPISRVVISGNTMSCERRTIYGDFEYFKAKDLNGLRDSIYEFIENVMELSGNPIKDIYICAKIGVTGSYISREATNHEMVITIY